MAAHGLEVPEPLPANRDAWFAFVQVADCYAVPMAGRPHPAWADIKPVLEVHGLWSASVQSRLRTCFNEYIPLDLDRSRKAD